MQTIMWPDDSVRKPTELLWGPRSLKGGLVTWVPPPLAALLAAVAGRLMLLPMLRDAEDPVEPERLR